ncbi:hypothetical protein ACWEV0_12175, partial [Streptomyces sp. NPDC003943]
LTPPPHPAAPPPPPDPPGGPPPPRAPPPPLLRGTDDLDARLLGLAHQPDRAGERLRRRTAWDRALGEPPPWYRDLRADPDHLLRLLAALLLTGLARQEAEQRQTEQRVRAEERLFALETDARYAVLRRLDRPPTLGWALLGATLATAPWTFVIGLADLFNRANQAEIVLAWMLALPAAAVVFALELWIALYIGPPVYHPTRSLAGLLIRTGERPARAVRSRGRLSNAIGAAVLVALGALGLWAVVWAPWAWPATTVLALTAWTVRRWWAWRRTARDARLDRAARRAAPTPRPPAQVRQGGAPRAVAPTGRNQ